MTRWTRDTTYLLFFDKLVEVLRSLAAAMPWDEFNIKFYKRLVELSIYMSFAYQQLGNHSSVTSVHDISQKLRRFATETLDSSILDRPKIIKQECRQLVGLCLEGMTSPNFQDEAVMCNIHNFVGTSTQPGALQSEFYSNLYYKLLLQVLELGARFMKCCFEDPVEINEGSTNSGHSCKDPQASCAKKEASLIDETIFADLKNESVMDKTAPVQVVHTASVSKSKSNECRKSLAQVIPKYDINIASTILVECLNILKLVQHILQHNTELPMVSLTEVFIKPLLELVSKPIPPHLATSSDMILLNLVFSKVLIQASLLNLKKDSILNTLLMHLPEGTSKPPYPTLRYPLQPKCVQESLNYSDSTIQGLNDTDIEKFGSFCSHTEFEPQPKTAKEKNSWIDTQVLPVVLNVVENCLNQPEVRNSFSNLDRTKLISSIQPLMKTSLANLKDELLNGYVQPASSTELGVSGRTFWLLETFDSLNWILGRLAFCNLDFADCKLFLSMTKNSLDLAAKLDERHLIKKLREHQSLFSPFRDTIASFKGQIRLLQAVSEALTAKREILTQSESKSVGTWRAQIQPDLGKALCQACKEFIETASKVPKYHVGEFTSGKESRLMQKQPQRNVECEETVLSHEQTLSASYSMSRVSSNSRNWRTLAGTENLTEKLISARLVEEFNLLSGGVTELEKSVWDCKYSQLEAQVHVLDLVYIKDIILHYLVPLYLELGIELSKPDEVSAALERFGAVLATPGGVSSSERQSQLAQRASLVVNEDFQSLRDKVRGAAPVKPPPSPTSWRERGGLQN